MQQLASLSLPHLHHPDAASTLNDSQPLGSKPTLERSVSSASSGTGTSDVTWTRTPTPTSVRDSRVKKSEYWQYFSKKTTSTGEIRAYCNFCTVSYKVPCTSNMAYHMMSSHSTKIVTADQATLVNHATHKLEVVKVTNYLRFKN